MPARSGPGRGRHVPERRCLACGRRAAKGELARFVAVRDGDTARLVRDDRGARGGRGLYVCRGQECFDRAVTRNAFARAARLGGTRVLVDDAAAREG